MIKKVQTSMDLIKDKISAHSTNQAHSKGEGEADTTSNHQAASSAGWVQTPTLSGPTCQNKIENNSFTRS